MDSEAKKGLIVCRREEDSLSIAFRGLVEEGTDRVTRKTLCDFLRKSGTPKSMLKTYFAGEDLDGVDGSFTEEDFKRLFLGDGESAGGDGDSSGATKSSDEKS